MNSGESDTDYSGLRYLDWFDCLDADSRPCLSDKEILKNLQAIVQDADKSSVLSVAHNAVGLLTTENRKIWSDLRGKIRSSNTNNRECLSVVDSALFVVCLDDKEPEDLGKLCENFLCGTYEMQNGVQVGTCTNRWCVEDYEDSGNTLDQKTEAE